MNLDQIIQVIGGIPINLDKKLNIVGIKDPKNATSKDIVFIFKELNPFRTKSKLIVARKKIEKFKYSQIIHPNPRLAMALLLDYLFPIKKNIVSHNISNAVISKNVKLFKPLKIKPFTCIGEGTEIEKNTEIGSSVSIGNYCKIGENCIIHSNVTIADHTMIGSNVIIHSGVVIGSDGFGYEQDKKRWVKIPHIGAVKIGDNVEIGSNTCIDRGCLKDTVICDGVKIDNLVQIAHNNYIGKNTIIAAGVLIGGSVTVEDQCIIAGDVTIKDNVHIGSKTTILGCSKVTKNLKEGQVVSGFPAINHSETLKYKSFLRKLFKTNN